MSKRIFAFASGTSTGPKRQTVNPLICHSAFRLENLYSYWNTCFLDIELIRTKTDLRLFAVCVWM